MPGVYREAWTGEVLKYMTTADQDTFLEGLPDYSQYVSNVGEEHQVIHIASMNVLPDVLYNNTSYPIAVQDLPFTDIPVTLGKHQTKATPITDDELFALSPKKMQNVVNRHGLAIQIDKVGRAIHSFGPSAATAAMPVLVTTGPDDGTGRRRLLWEDVYRLKGDCDILELDDVGRRLVLSKEHENDLLWQDQKFKDQFYNRKDGKPFNQLSFDFFSYNRNPYYNPATKTKLTYGAVPDVGESRASVFFLAQRTAKAIGWTKMYYSEAKQDPENQRNLINFRHHSIYLRTEEAAAGAIVSGVAM